MAKVGDLVLVHQTHLRKTDAGPQLERSCQHGLVTAVNDDGTVDVYVPQPTYSGLPVVDELADDHEGFAVTAAGSAAAPKKAAKAADGASS